MTRTRYGDQRGCLRCGQDIEWHGRAHGWIDRGANRQCPPYKNLAGDVVTPRKGLKHRPRLCTA